MVVEHVITGECRLHKWEMDPTDYDVYYGPSRGDKRMFSIGQSAAFRAAAEIKQEMMERYADGYYFFEEYVDDMMSAATVR
jgi:hypothetical protein